MLSLYMDNSLFIKKEYPIYINEKYQPNTLFEPSTTDFIPVPKIFKYPDRCVPRWNCSVCKYEWRQLRGRFGVTVIPEIIKIKKKNKKKVNLKVID